MAELLYDLVILSDRINYFSISIRLGQILTPANESCHSRPLRRSPDVDYPCRTFKWTISLAEAASWNMQENGGGASGHCTRSIF